MLSLVQLIQLRLKCDSKEMPLDGVIEHFPFVGGNAMEMSQADIAHKPSVVVINNAKRYLFPAAREPPFITMLLAFSGVLVMSSKLSFLCQAVDAFPSYRW